MEESVLCAHKGRLLCIHQREKLLELESFRHIKLSGFCSESGFPATLTSKVTWHIETVKECTDDKTGIETLFLLASCTSSVQTGTRFCILRVRWRGGEIFSHQGAHTSNGIDGAALDIQPVYQFTCTEQLETLKPCFCVLTYGPRVILVNHNKLILFHKDSKRKYTYQKQEFLIIDGENNIIRTLPGVQSSDILNYNQVDSRILSVASQQDWSICVIHASGKSWQTIVAIAFEISADGHLFSRKILSTRHFMPQEYASKVSAVTVDWCKRTVMPNQSHVYENTCVVGLNDGYVMTFTNGVMKTCVSLWSQVNSAYPACAVTEVMPFNDVLICHTNTGDCFAVSRTEGKEVHHWDSVHKAVVGDFLQCGGRQLLLLFNGWSPQRPNADSLLTDLQGFVQDGRESQEETLSQKIFRRTGEQKICNMSLALYKNRTRH